MLKRDNKKTKNAEIVTTEEIVIPSSVWDSWTNEERGNFMSKNGMRNHKLESFDPSIIYAELPTKQQQKILDSLRSQQAQMHFANGGPVSMDPDLLKTITHALNMIPNKRNVGPDGESSYDIASELGAAKGSISPELFKKIKYAFNRIPNKRNVGASGESSYDIASRLDKIEMANGGPVKGKKSNAMKKNWVLEKQIIELKLAELGVELYDQDTKHGFFQDAKYNGNQIEGLNYLIDDNSNPLPPEVADLIEKYKNLEPASNDPAEFIVFNYTDGITAAYDSFDSFKAAQDFIDEFPKRYEAQGYYKDNQGNKLDPKDVELEILPLGAPFFREESEEEFIQEEQSSYPVDITHDLINFDLTNLDPLEEMNYAHFSKSMSKEEALQVIINTVEGDFSQLNEPLAALAMKQVGEGQTEENNSSNNNTTMQTAADFINGLTLSALPAEMQAYIKDTLLSDPDQGLIPITDPKVSMIKELIEKKYPQALQPEQAEATREDMVATIEALKMLDDEDAQATVSALELLLEDMPEATTAPVEKKKTSKSDPVETCYIEFLNKKKNFQPDKKYFSGKTGEEAITKAREWALKNLENFNMDMIKWKISESSDEQFKHGGKIKEGETFFEYFKRTNPTNRQKNTNKSGRAKVESNNK